MKGVFSTFQKTKSPTGNGMGFLCIWALTFVSRRLSFYKIFIDEERMARHLNIELIVDEVGTIACEGNHLNVKVDMTTDQVVENVDALSLEMGSTDQKRLIKALFDELNSSDQTEILSALFGDGEFEDTPDYHPSAMGCGLEDRHITDSYEAMEYGWNAAIEKSESAFKDWLDEKLGR